MNTRTPFFRLAVVILALTLPTFAFAGSIGKAAGGGDSIRFDISATGHDSIVLVVAHGDEVYTKTFKAGKPVAFNLRDMPSDVDPEGSYLYELRYVPAVSPSLQKKLAGARASGDEKAAKKALKDAGIVVPETQTGSFLVSGGSIVDPDAQGEANNAKSSPNLSTNGIGTAPTLRGPAGRFTPETLDQVIPDDLIVQSSLCVGFDCVDGESFGFDTIRMKENNTQAHFEDTSTSAGFPTNDWRIIANDSGSGGASYLAVQDATAAIQVARFSAGAPANSLFVSSAGDIGSKTSAPALDFQATVSDTPGIRLEQTNAAGFTAQTWDIAGNEANFFVRDLTGGSKLSFRIRPGAPTSSIDIAADGDVGIGTASPQARLDVRGTNAHVLAGSDTADFLGAAQTGYGASNGTEKLFFAVQTGLAFIGSTSNTSLGLVTNNSTKMTVTSGGNVGIGTLTPGSQLVLVNGAASSSINAGATTFTAASSRTFKDNIEPVAVDDILTRISSVPVVTYDYKDNGPKNRLGLVAEEFHTVLGRGDEKYIDGQDVQMALWLAVQKLTAENKALTDRLENLESKVVTTPASND